MKSQLTEFQRQFTLVNQQGSTMSESHQKLKEYHDSLQKRVQNTATEKLTREVEDVVEDSSLIDCSIQSQQAVSSRSVSYTHLTLPTIYSV